MKPDEVFRRSLDARFTVLETALNDAVDTIASEVDGPRRKDVILALGHACREYASLLSEMDHPQWLKAIQGSIARFSNNSDRENFKRVLRTIMTHRMNVQAIEPGSGAEAFAFDRYFEELREEATVAERFANLAAEMQKLIDEEEITDTAAVKLLERMIAALKTNQRASYVSTIFTMDFVKNGWIVVAAISLFANQTSGTVRNVVEMMTQTDAKVQGIRDSLNKRSVAVIKDLSPRIKAIADQKLARIGNEPIDVEYTHVEQRVPSGGEK